MRVQVSVVGRAMVRKFQAKLRALDEMKKAVEEAQVVTQIASLSLSRAFRTRRPPGTHA